MATGTYGFVGIFRGPILAKMKTGAAVAAQIILMRIKMAVKAEHLVA